MPASRYIGAILAPAAVLASRHAIPGPTATVSPDPVDGFSPRITGAARVDEAAIELLKRYVDYDQTCGFVNGDPAKCTDASAPYCVDWKYDYITTTLAGYGCDVSAFTGTVEYTYSGQDTFDISSYLTSIPEFSLPTVFVTQTQVLSAGLSSGTSTSSSSSSSGSDDGDDDNSKKVSIGAIVGGVVGGLGALAILGGVVICLLFKRRRDKRNAAAAAAFQPAHHQQQQQSGPPPPPPQQHNHQPPPPPMPYAGGPPGGPNDYKPPPPHMSGVPQMQQQQQQQQPGNTPASFYGGGGTASGGGSGGSDVKYEYSQAQSVSSVSGTPGPYSPPMSPVPLYTPSPPPPPVMPHHHQQQQQQQQGHQRWGEDVPQIDGTPVHKNSEGQQVHEAP
ncbi:hypothetical protein SLS54_005261 [Diplodia seriata]